MTYDEVENAYQQLRAVIPSIWSTFKVCSKDDNCGHSVTYLVSSLVPCYDFDRIKLHFYKTGISSADSLHFSSTKETLYFIEFKNARFRNFFESIPKKAHDSLYVHRCVCGSNDVLRMDNVFVVVMSDDKNLDFNPSAIMMRNSGYFSSTTLMNELAELLKSGFDMYSKEDEFRDGYTDFAVVLSSRFNEYVASIC